MTTDSNAAPIYFRCDGGREDGLGHLSRCLALADALAAPGGSAIVLTHSPDGVGADAVARRGHRSRLAPESAGRGADLQFVLDVIQGEQESGRRPILVVDSRCVDEDYVRACSELCFSVCLDDEQLRDLPCDVLINGHVWVSVDDYPARAGRTVLAGSRYNLVRQDYFREKADEGASPAGTQSGSLSVLITLGGEDPGNHTCWLVEQLADLLAAQATTIVVGPAHPDPESVQRAVARHLPSAEVVRDPPSMVPYITAAEVAITAGGTTCYELAAARVAQAAIAIEDHQERLVAALEERGCLVALGNHRDLSADAVREAIADLLGSADLRQAMHRSQAALFPASGVPAISEAVRAAYQQAG